MLPFAGSIEIEFRLAALTVSGVLSLTAPKAALMFVVPTFLATARPLVVMDATEFAEDFHVAVPVTS